MSANEQAVETGMDVRDLHTDAGFAARRLRTRDAMRQIEALGRLAQLFATKPDQLQQELVDIAMDMCGAGSAGISLEENDENGEQRFRWVATGGKFSHFVNGGTPRFFSPCGTCLDRGKAQLFRVTKPYYDILGIEAEPVTDGMLIPWETEGTRGTIWVVAHESAEAFDYDDYTMMRSLANFVAIAVRHQKHQKLLMKNATAVAAAAMANELAHQINNPLQSLTNTLFLLVRDGHDGHANQNAQLLAEQAAVEIARLSSLVTKLLAHSRTNPTPE